MNNKNYWKIGFVILLLTVLSSAGFFLFYWTQNGNVVNSQSGSTDSLRKWAEDYNDTQWEKHLNNWQKVKDAPEIKQALSCKSTIDNKVAELEPIYLDSLREQELGSANPKSRYYVSLYETFKSISDELSDFSYWYDTEEPRFEGGLFILTEFKGNLQAFDQKYVDERIDDTEITLDYYNSQFQKDLTEAKNFHCPDLSSFNINTSLTSNQCKEIVGFFNSVAYQPERDGFELEGEYLIAVEKFKKEQDSKLEYCSSISQWDPSYFR